MATDAWSDMLIALYPEDNDAERLANLIFFITNNPAHQAPLNKLVIVRSAFMKYLGKIEAEMDGTLMQYLDETQIVEADNAQGFQFTRPGEATTMFTANGLMVLEKMPSSLQIKAIETISNVMKQSSSATVRSFSGKLVELSSDKVVRYLKYGGVALMVAQMSWEAVNSMKEWWKGEISGIRAAKQVVDCLGSIGGGMVGGDVGFMIGSATIGPAGAVGGAIIGGVAGSLAAGGVTDRLTQWMFSLPKHVALENACNFLGVGFNADNSVVNTKFRELCLRYHPDKGDTKEDFHKLQISMQVIRMSRGQ
eukprot:TRINITY_DN45875_c0_g1_i1.p1 TRINITY_DN45875_c0_g1~~TRINITY_DN45875_c0_g1_i1.p1  ORF type:complete len:331 (-),score=52.45 TRINITY_DN45875_c0_g1_i1:103-1026(-)